MNEMNGSGILIMTNNPVFSVIMVDKLLRDGIPANNIYTSTRGTDAIPRINQNPNLPSIAAIERYLKKENISNIIFNPSEKVFLPIVDHFLHSPLSVIGLSNAAHHYLTNNELIATACEVSSVIHASYVLCSDRQAARAFKGLFKLPVIIKNEKKEAQSEWGFICHTEKQFEQAIHALLSLEKKDSNSKSVRKCMLQRYIEGEYLYINLLCKQREYRILNGNVDNDIREKVIEPLLFTLKAIRADLSSFLHIRLVKTAREIVVIDVSPFCTIEKMKNLLSQEDPLFLSLPATSPVTVQVA